MLQHDPALEGVACVVFDEFHERNLQGDLGLALALECQRHLRPDLRLLVMSATLDAEALARVLDDARFVRAPGRMFDVQTIYASAPAVRARRCRRRRSRRSASCRRSTRTRATCWRSCPARARSAA